MLIDQRWIKSFESLSSINRSNERGKGVVEIYQNSSGTIAIPEVCIFEKIVHSVKNWSFFLILFQKIVRSLKILRICLKSFRKFVRSVKNSFSPRSFLINDHFFISFVHRSFFSEQNHFPRKISFVQKSNAHLCLPWDSHLIISGVLTGRVTPFFSGHAEKIKRLLVISFNKGLNINFFRTFTNTVHLYLWLFFLCFPFSIHLVRKPLIYNCQNNMHIFFQDKLRYLPYFYSDRGLLKGVIVNRAFKLLEGGRGGASAITSIFALNFFFTKWICHVNEKTLWL